MKRRPRQLSLALRQAGSFDVARADPFNLDWITSPTSINQAIWLALPNLRARSRDMGRNSPFYRRFLKSSRQNVAGARGVRFQNRARDREGELLTAVNQRVEAAYLRFSRAGQFDVTGKLSRPMAEQLYIASLLRDGEVIVRRWRGQPTDMGLAVQFIDPERLDKDLNDRNPTTGNSIVMGVEVTDLGRPVAYWFKNVMDNASPFLDPATASPGRRRTRIEAVDILHSFIIEETEQIRGFPEGVASILTLKDLDGYREAAIIAAREGANKHTVIKSAEGESATESERDELGQRIRDSAPGEAWDIGADDEIEAYDPTYPHGEYKDFNRQTLRGAAAGMAPINYSTLAQDFEGVNLSSIRWAGLDERDGWQILQQMMIEHFTDPVFWWWAGDAAALGAVEGLTLANLDDIAQPAWLARRWQSPEPLKDAQADDLRIRQRTKSQSEIIESMGGDPDEVFTQIAADQEKLSELGIVTESEAENGEFEEEDDDTDAPDDDRDGDSLSRRYPRAAGE